MENCTRCGKRFTDLKIEISQVVETNRLKDNHVWEKLPNLNIVSKEILCKECFDIYADNLSKIMAK